MINGLSSSVSFRTISTAFLIIILVGEIIIVLWVWSNDMSNLIVNVISLIPGGPMMIPLPSGRFLHYPVTTSFWDVEKLLSYFLNGDFLLTRGFGCLFRFLPFRGPVSPDGDTIL